MALRIKETAFVILLAARAFAAGELRFQVRHEHLRKGCPGILRVDEQGITFEGEPSKKRHAWRWEFSDIQQLKIEPQRMAVLTYEDRKWRLGADRGFEFTLPAGVSFGSAYRLLKDRLDQRLVAALAEERDTVLWKLPVKRAGRIKGAQGTLVVSTTRVTFETAEPGASRTWRYSDLDNISSSGPFEFTVTTYERSRTDYGSLKSFHFQLKQPLTEDRYNDLWWRLNQNRIRRIQ
ncbi:MAG: hypothetical protein LLG20_03990 [Acidobacteriales bacterium]|nr:hypothetical protein [Terriglobales bacterium]